MSNNVRIGKDLWTYLELSMCNDTVSGVGRCLLLIRYNTYLVKLIMLTRAKSSCSLAGCQP